MKLQYIEKNNTCFVSLLHFPHHCFNTFHRRQSTAPVTLVGNKAYISKHNRNGILKEDSEELPSKITVSASIDRNRKVSNPAHSHCAYSNEPSVYFRLQNIRCQNAPTTRREQQLNTAQLGTTLLANAHNLA